ncbi:MAG: helix-turn-helix transcriptional regulator [Alphaproteobacteria bacterium]|nr:helix-turn-helix transcriptional regulator [Alphaproteobacteria bacterium]
MLTHADIWRAIDTLAREHGLSPSGLARRAGLDPTTFNKSKRITREGKARWPSTESVAKILRATGASVEEFVSYLSEQGGGRPARRIPVLSYAQAAGSGYFDESGYPTGDRWDEVEFPKIDDPRLYALEVSGSALLPAYRDGDLMIVSPAAGLRRGDRVVVRTVSGQLTAHELVRQSALKLELLPLVGGTPERVLPASDVSFVHRIVWASQ